MLRNIQNIRICKGKKPIVSVTYDYERISLKNSLEDDFVGCRSFRSSTSRQWLEKSSKHVGSNFTLKPKTKASSLQFCKTEIKADIVGKKKEISDGYMAYLSTEETSAILLKTGQVESG